MASAMGQCCGSVTEKDLPSNPDWMGKLPSSLHDTPLNQLAIPGSHDSTSYFLDKNAPLGPDAATALKDACKIFGSYAKTIVYNWSRAQGMQYDLQLQAGIRYLDLRISIKPGTQDLYLVHGMYSNPLTDCLKTVNTFLTAHPKEVVLLDMNHFYGLSPDHHNYCLSQVMSIFGDKLCPYLDIDSVTLNTLWENKFQVLVFYQDPAARDNFMFWPGMKIPSPWPNVADTDQLMKILETNYTRGRPKGTFYVTQGVLTPDTSLVLRNLFSTLEKCCSDKAAPTFVKWLSGKQAGPKGINVCIMDFVHLEEYISTVIRLNTKSS